MKKPDFRRELILAQKRLNKKLKRKRLNRKYIPTTKSGVYFGLNELQVAALLKNTQCPHYKYYSDKNFIDGDVLISPILNVPTTFSLTKEYSDTVQFIKKFISKLYSFTGEGIEVNFKDCTEVDIAALFILRIIYREYFQFSRRLFAKQKRILPRINFVKFIKSGDEEVNQKLIIMKLIQEPVISGKGLIPVMSTDLIVGSKSQKKYYENIKGQTSTAFVSFINRCIKRHGFMLNATGVNDFEGIITEILNNAEDHSDFDKWYACAALFETPNNADSEEFVGEVNLLVFNFGHSIAEGLEETKLDNYEVYSQMEQLYEQVTNGLLWDFKKSFTKSNFLTLYSLSEGMSRLKYIEESRGTGTIRFLNSFIRLGDYEDEKANFAPKLHIISGNSMLICDKKHKPYQQGGVFYLSLNPENDLTKLPSKENLIYLKEDLPGTLLSVKIYLNKKHLKEKFLNNDNQDN